MENVIKYEVNAEKAQAISDKFTSGEVTAQNAFGDLIRLNYEAFTSVPADQRRGMRTRLSEQLALYGLGKGAKNLSSSYISPSLTLAVSLVAGEMSGALSYILAQEEDGTFRHLEDTGADLAGSVTSGPLYTPGRLNAAWGSLSNKGSTSPWQVDMEGLFILDDEGNEVRWHEMDIKALVRVNGGKERTKEESEYLIGVLGDPKDFDKRPGQLGRLIKTLCEANEKFASDLITGLTDALGEVLADQRDAVEVNIQKARVAEAKRALAKTEKRKAADVEARLASK